MDKTIQPLSLGGRQWVSKMDLQTQQVVHTQVDRKEPCMQAPVPGSMIPTECNNSRNKIYSMVWIQSQNSATGKLETWVGENTSVVFYVVFLENKMSIKGRCQNIPKIIS